MDEVYSIVQTIKDKAQELGNQKRMMADRIEELERQIESLQQEMEDSRRELDELKEKNNVLKMAKSLDGGAEKSTEAKRRVNELVKEIDKCIARLNK